METLKNNQVYPTINVFFRFLTEWVSLITEK